MAHLLGDLKDPRPIPILVPLLTDPDEEIDERLHVHPELQPGDD